MNESEWWNPPWLLQFRPGGDIDFTQSKHEQFLSISFKLNAQSTNMLIDTPKHFPNLYFIPPPSNCNFINDLLKFFVVMTVLTKRHSDSTLPTPYPHKRRSFLDIILGRHKRKELTTKGMDPLDRYLESQKSQTQEQVPDRPHTWPRSSIEEFRFRPVYIPRLNPINPKATWKTVKNDVTSLRDPGVRYRMKDVLKQKVLIEMYETSRLELLERDACREDNARRRQDVYYYRTNYRGKFGFCAFKKLLLNAEI